MIKCQVCKSSEVICGPEIQSPFVDQKYTLYNCRACRSFFFNPNQYPFDQRDFYNHPRQAASTDFAESDYWSSQVAIISRLLGKNRRGISVLDVGSRAGDFLMHWPEADRRLGIEPHAQNAENARRRGLEVYCGFVQDYAPHERFDVVSCFAVLEHVGDPAPVLRRLAELVKPSGVLVIMIPSFETGLRKLLDWKGLYWHMYAPPSHLTYYSRSFLDGFLFRQGLSLVKRYYTSGGISSNYLPLTATNRLLHDGSFGSLNTYFSNALQDRIAGSEGRSVELLRYFETALANMLDNYTPLRFLPFFDHMYSYYKPSLEAH